MKFFDNHTHSDFSPDSGTSIEDCVKGALSLDMAGIAITDHYDVDAPTPDQEYLFDPAQQQEEIDRVMFRECGKLALQGRKFELLKGIEVGLQPHNMEKVKNFTAQYKFDTVVASVHFVDGLDPYKGTYYGDKDYRRAYGRALELICSTALDYRDFDIIGHYDYVARYSPYGPGCRDITLKDFGDYFETLFKFLIAEGKTFEINTKTYKNHRGYVPQLDPAILRRFREMGGEALSLGSDTHCGTRYGENFETYARMAKENGFRYLMYFKDRKPHYYKIDL